MVTGLQGHRDGGYYFRAAFRRKWENAPKLRKTPPKPATRGADPQICKRKGRFEPAARWATKAAKGETTQGSTDGSSDSANQDGRVLQPRNRTMPCDFQKNAPPAVDSMPRRPFLRAAAGPRGTQPREIAIGASLPQGDTRFESGDHAMEHGEENGKAEVHDKANDRPGLPLQR